jgi:hypothetical protein
MSKGANLAERLEAKTKRCECGGCWEWTGGLRRGYGLIQADGKTVSVHRVSWELANGPIPVGMQVLHRCDNGKCLNPDHLFIGTQKDNIEDAVNKGRKPEKFRPIPIESVRLIREMAANGHSARACSIAAGCDNMTARGIIYGNRRRWN